MTRFKWHFFCPKNSLRLTDLFTPLAKAYPAALLDVHHKVEPQEMQEHGIYICNICAPEWVLP